LLSSTLDDPNTGNVETEAHMMSAPMEIGIEWNPRTDEIKTAYSSAPITLRDPGVQVDTVTITRAEPERKHVSDAAAKVYEQWACGGGMPLDDFESLHAGMGTVLLTVAEHDALRAEVERLTDEIKRLRKGKDESRLGTSRSGVNACNSVRGDVSRLLVGEAHTTANLDPRLGTQQPDGAPCEPMSARKWRWGVL
jgi:hypothetical protein